MGTRLVMRDLAEHRWLRAYFFASAGGLVVLAVFALGVAVGTFKLFPYSLLERGAAAARDWIRYPRHHVRLRPEKFLVPQPAAASTAAQAAVRLPGAFDGVTFVDGFFGRSTGMRLLAMNGDVLHEWPVAFNDLWPDATHVERAIHDWDAQIHGALLYPNGDVVFNFQYGGLARIDACGRPIWRLAEQTHHSVYEDENGHLWVPSRRRHDEPSSALPGAPVPYYEDLVLELSPDGRVLREISVLDVIVEGGQSGLLYANGEHGAVLNLPLDGDFTHLNDVDVLEPSIAAAFPMFEAGDLLLSLRNLNLLLVVDPDTAVVKWWMVGPYLRQHDPDFLPNGRISVFDNRRDGAGGQALGGSRILEIDPATREISVVYGDREDQRFYTETMGEHQHLPNGNVLITESEAGRAFEVAPSGEIVWSYVNRWDEESAALIGRAVRYPASYAESIEAESCNDAKKQEG